MKTDTPARQDKPLATVRLGVQGLATIEIPIDRSAFGRLRRRFWTPWWERVSPSGAQIIVTVPEDDEGSLDAYLTLANFGRRKVHVEAVSVTWVAIGNGGLHEVTADFPRPKTLLGRGVGRILFRINFGSANVRRVLRSIGEPRNRYSSPTASVAIRGRLVLIRGRTRKTVDFVVENVTPRLDICNPAARAADS